MSDKLKPCPFCGREPKTWWDYKPAEDDLAYHESNFEGYNISCCLAEASSIYKDDCIEKWNTRPEDIKINYFAKGVKG